MILKLWSELTKRPINLVYTFGIQINLLAYGISGLLPDIFLVDLKYIYDTDIVKISFLASFNNVGYIAGTLFGFVYKWINRQLVLTIATSIMALFIVFISMYGNLYLLFFFDFFFGMGSGAWCSACTVWILEMWPLHQGLMMNLTQFMWSIGSIIAPVLSAPFVYGNVTNATSDFVPSLKDRQMSLLIPSSVAGIIQGIGPALLLVLLFVSPYRYIKENTSDDISLESPKEISLVSTNKVSEEYNSDKFKVKYRKFKLTLLAILISMYNMCETSYLVFSTTLFQYLDIKLSASDSARLLSVVTTGYTLGCLLTSFISLFVKNKIILITHLLLVLSSLTFIYIFQHDLTKLRIASFFIGYGFSAIYPSMYIYTNKNLKMTHRASTCFSILNGFNSFLLPVIIGPALRTNPPSVFLLIGGNLLFCFIFFIFIDIFLKFTK